jgi:hypothetical protein
MLGLDQNAISAAFSQPDHDGRFSGSYADYLEKLSRKKHAVFFAFPPKAAGTFLRTAAIVAIDGQLIRIVHAQGGRDAQLYLPVLVSYYCGALGTKPMVAHVHMQALAGNRAIVDVFGLKPIVMIRPIPDMLASYWDMLETDDVALQDGLNCQFPRDFRSRQRSQKAAFLVDMVAPWYVGYYATWVEYAAQCPDKVLVLDYDEFAQAPDVALEQILLHSGIARSRALCQKTIEQVWSERAQWRFNLGRSGRGEEYFEPHLLRRIRDLLSHYPSLDGFMERLAR